MRAVDSGAKYPIELVNAVWKAALVLRHLGLRWACFRLSYAWRRRTGALQRQSPRSDWDEVATPPAARLPMFHPPAPPWRPDLTEADAVLQGRFRLFQTREVEAGLEPAWHRNQLTGESVSADIHWSGLGDFALGDIKGVWELSRFSWAFALGRAYAATREADYATRFWALFSDWIERNPPNSGPNWMCGQEATFRLMAVVFAREACADAAAPAQIESYARFVAATGARIAANLDYALSQSNNHGVSECVGLITAAAVLPAHPAAAEWSERGWRSLERQLAELVYADGGFAQHSANYHRVLLHDVLWCLALQRARGQEAPAFLRTSGQRALAFLDALVNRHTGRVPNYGPNDGANVLQLSGAPFHDHRPTLRAAYALLHGCRMVPVDSGDEMTEWLAGPAGGAADWPAQLEQSHFPTAGVLLWRSGSCRLLLRCPTQFRHRPTQADMLHVDLEWRDVPVVFDAGTYSYSPGTSARGALADAAVHNTATIDGDEPMRKVSRFLYLPWPRGAAGWDGDARWFEATHDGWGWRDVQHRRRIASPAGERFVVEDRLSGHGPHRVRLHWLLLDAPFQFEPQLSRLTLQTSPGSYRLQWSGLPASARVTVQRADPESSRGWWSPCYQSAEPALSLALEFPFEGDVSVTMSLGPVDAADERKP